MYLKVIWSKCPKCKKQAERIGIFWNNNLTELAGCKCSFCGFRQKADLENTEQTNFNFKL